MYIYIYIYTYIYIYIWINPALTDTFVFILIVHNRIHILSNIVHTYYINVGKTFRRVSKWFLLILTSYINIHISEFPYQSRSSNIVFPR